MTKLVVSHPIKHQKTLQNALHSYGTNPAFKFGWNTIFDKPPEKDFQIMSLIELMIALLIALICGSIAQSLAGFSRLGCFATIALGFIGALLGSWLARLLELPDILSINIGNSQFPIVWSIIGGALFAAVLNALTPRPVR